MLVLGREKNESIVIDGNIVVTFIEMRGSRCRLGITAPAEISVHRQEIYDAIQRLRWRGSKAILRRRYKADILTSLEDVIKYVKHLDQGDGMVPTAGLIEALEEIAAKCRAKEAA